MTESADELFEMVRAAYERGYNWGQENPDSRPFLNKAAYDYADKTTSALALRTPSDGVKVKPLEWIGVIPGRMFADIYMIERLYLDDWRLMLRANEHGNWPKFIAGPFTLDEAKAAAQADYNARILTELQSLRAAAKVRATREGDGEVCATEGCGNAATERFESGGVGSIHCPSCIANIAAIAASPIPTTGGEKE